MNEEKFNRLLKAINIQQETINNIIEKNKEQQEEIKDLKSRMAEVERITRRNLPMR